LELTHGWLTIGSASGSDRVSRARGVTGCLRAGAARGWVGVTTEADRVAGFGRLEDGLRQGSPWYMWVLTSASGDLIDPLE